MVNTEEQDWFSYKDENGREICVSGTDSYDPVQQVRHETAYRRWVDEDGQEVTRRARLAMRLLFPQEMMALLHYNGFKVLHRWGGWDSSPLTAESQRIIYECVRL
jgi:hypothetical protein